MKGGSAKAANRTPLRELLPMPHVWAKHVAGPFGRKQAAE